MARRDDGVLWGGAYRFEPNRREAKLGKGAFGTTFRMRNVCDDRLCAVKVLDVEDLADAGIDLEELKSEARIMVRISQEDPHHFVQYFTSFYHEDEDRGDKFYCIVMEL
jgi:serine/threonine protein kinase